ncbi:MAG TPA: hypothetical protein VEI83_03615 [Acidimicrobiales bacterium]|nr:hypothetical protein [Acidimicrobiales bacterium]
MAGTAPFGVYLFASGDPAANAARDVERAVFLEVFGNTEELLEKEYAPYEAASVILCVMDHRREVAAGMMRVLLPSAAGFKSLNDLEPCWGVRVPAMLAATGIELEERRTWDIATLAVAPEYRGKGATGLVTMGLFQAVTMTAWRLGMDWFVAVLDLPVFRLVRWRLHMTWAGFTDVPPMPYLGSSASLPAWCRIGPSKDFLAARDPDLHDLLFEGVGLGPALTPVDLDAAAERVAGVAAALVGPAAPCPLRSTT